MADYDFYKNCYQGGSIPQTEFRRLALQAAAQLARYQRMYTVRAPLACSEDKAVCAMADALYYFETVHSGAGGPVASASIGSVAVRYNSAGSAVDLSLKGQAKELYRCAGMYLDIYRGCC